MGSFYIAMWCERFELRTSGQQIFFQAEQHDDVDDVNDSSGDGEEGSIRRRWLLLLLTC